MPYGAKTRNVGEHAPIPVARFDQKVYGFRYNAVLRPALFRAAGFLILRTPSRWYRAQAGAILARTNAGRAGMYLVRHKYWQFFYWFRFILLVVAGAAVAIKTLILGH
jgi:hypothetical protein